MGAWIETTCLLNTLKIVEVAPYVGAWIETHVKGSVDQFVRSHPTWVRGLKLAYYKAYFDRFCRTLRGCVD